MNMHDSPPLCRCQQASGNSHLQQLAYLHMPYAFKYVSYTFGLAAVENN
jgi:hypothetical protein